MELNCSVGKGRRKITQSSSNDNGSVESSASMPSLSHQQQQFFRSKVDERVSANGGNREPFLIGVAGGTASGKSTVCNLIMNSLQEKRVVLLAQDSFYRPLTEEERKNVKQYNFDPVSYTHLTLPTIYSV